MLWLEVPEIQCPIYSYIYICSAVSITPFICVHPVMCPQNNVSLFVNHNVAMALE